MAEDDLVGQAVAAKAALDDADLRVTATRGRLRYWIGRLHADGRSYRDIAELLGLSHQRIHQLADVAIETGRLTDGPATDPACTVCGTDRGPGTGRLVAGPAGFAICAGCVGTASAVLAGGTERSHAGVRFRAASERRGACAFCRRRAGSRRRHAAATTGVHVCAECLAACREALETTVDDAGPATG